MEYACSSSLLTREAWLKELACNQSHLPKQYSSASMPITAKRKPPWKVTLPLPNCLCNTIAPSYHPLFWPYSSLNLTALTPLDGPPASLGLSVLPSHQAFFSLLILGISRDPTVLVQLLQASSDTISLPSASACSCFLPTPQTPAIRGFFPRCMNAVRNLSVYGQRNGVELNLKDRFPKSQQRLCWFLSPSGFGKSNRSWSSHLSEVERRCCTSGVLLSRGQMEFPDYNFSGHRSAA